MSYTLASIRVSQISRLTCSFNVIYIVYLEIYTNTLSLSLTAKYKYSSLCHVIQQRMFYLPYFLSCSHILYKPQIAHTAQHQTVDSVEKHSAIVLHLASVTCSAFTVVFLGEIGCCSSYSDIKLSCSVLHFPVALGSFLRLFP